MAEIRLYGYCGDEWDGFTAASFAEEMKGIDPSDDLDIYINSGGGSVWDGVTIYQTLAQRPGFNRVQVMGMSASIATVIQMSGDEIVFGQASSMLIHDPMGPSSIAFGTAEDLEDAAEATLKTAAYLKSILTDIVQVYAARTGLGETQLREWMAEETIFNSADALKHGFATSVLENKSVAATSLQRPKAFEVKDVQELSNVASLCSKMVVRQPRASKASSRWKWAQAKQQQLALDDAG